MLKDILNIIYFKYLFLYYTNHLNNKQNNTYNKSGYVIIILNY